MKQARMPARPDETVRTGPTYRLSSRETRPTGASLICVGRVSIPDANNIQ